VAELIPITMTQGWVTTPGQVLTSEMIDYKFSDEIRKRLMKFIETPIVFLKKFATRASLSPSLS
jgi:hypothetical protein